MMNELSKFKLGDHVIWMAMETDYFGRTEIHGGIVTSINLTKEGIGYSIDYGINEKLKKESDLFLSSQENELKRDFLEKKLQENFRIFEKRTSKIFEEIKTLNIDGCYS